MAKGKSNQNPPDALLLQGLLLRIALPGILTVALLITVVFGFFIPLLEDNMMQGRQETTQELAHSVCTLLQSYAEMVPDQTTEAEAQAQAISHIRRLRYGPEGKDYFWINDMHPTMIMHPYRTELEGLDLSNYQDPNGVNLFVESVSLVTEKNSGFIEYQWWWQDTEKVGDKISFVQGFKPWGWVVGTGLYLEDVKADISLLKNRMIGAASILVVFIGLLISFMTRQRFLAEKNRALAEEKLRQSQKMEAIGQLAGGIAHDFNNLLGSIMGNADLLQNSTDLVDEDKESVEQIVKASERSADLVRQLLSFSRKGQLQNKVVNIHDLIDEVIALLSRSIDPRITILRQLKAEHPYVSGDDSMLQNAILNLGVNARDAICQTPPDSHSVDELVFSSSEVWIDQESASRRGDQLEPGWYLRVRVSDSGCGMSKQVLDRVFEPFFTTKDVGKGTGLGLASSYGCMQTHRGSLTVESEPGVGTTFTMLLPRSQEVAPEQPTREIRVSGAGKRILFVDDDEALRQTMVRVLGRLGYEVVTCGDGLQAIEFYTENHENIDLIILDLIMSHMGGEVAFARLRAINPEVQILISSGFARNHVVEELLRSGACGFLAKPFKISELSEVLAAHISG